MTSQSAGSICARYRLGVASGLAALFVAALLQVSPAGAAVIQISATSFALRCPCVNEPPASEEVGQANQGTLTSAEGSYYAAVPFPTEGARVCRFSLIYRDNDADSQIVARLYKKRIVLGQPPFNAPVEMARVVTGVATSSAGVQKGDDLSIRQSIVRLTDAFYYVEIQTGSDLLEVLGVQIEWDADGC
jgi:hypothetical protein